jgi:hypothetical protein
MTTPFDAFGPGAVWVTRTDIGNSTPVNVGFSQELSIDFSASEKQLTGQNQYPIDVARGVTKITGKLKAAVISGIAWNNVFFGNSFSTGGFQVALNEAHSIPAVSTYTVTVTNATTFDTSGIAGGDLGVVYASGANAGLPFVKVATVSAAGQYTVNTATGVYTFGVADEGAAVLISYRYTTTAGQTLNVTNQLLGYTPIFQLDYYTIRNNAPFLVRLFQCTTSKLSIAAKLEDFLMPEFDFGGFANSAGVAIQLSFPQVS